MATIYDVAQRAGVAPTTVSRVINHSGYVGAETRQRVETAAQELGYSPNALARGLRLKKSSILGLVLTDITNPFWTTVARGVEDTASEAGFTVIFCNTDENPNRQGQYLHVLEQQQIDGLLLVPVQNASDQIRTLQKKQIPMVVLDRRIPGVHVDLVRCDSEGGAYDLTRLLLAQNHRRVALLTGPQSVSTSVDRIMGYRRALKEAGLAPDNEIIFSGVLTRESGCQLTQQALALHPRPTALLAANNFIASGALQALQEAGLHTPEDMALAAFDRLPPTWNSAAFTAIADQPAYEMGQQATRLLLERVAGKGPDKPQEVILPVKITQPSD